MKAAQRCDEVLFSCAGVGVGGMLHLMTSWRFTDLRESTASRLTATMRSAAVSVTITSLTALIAVFASFTSPFPSVKRFCALCGTTH